MEAEAAAGVQNYWPQISFVFNIIVAGFVGFIGAWLKLNLCAHRITSLENTIKELNDRTISQGEKLAEIKGGLDRDRAHPQYIKAESPLTLTDQGKAVLLDSTGKDFIDSKKQELINEIKSRNPKSAYDVQEIARQVIMMQTNDNAFVPIKNFAYQRGEELKLIADVLAIYLRDIAMKECGFEISDLKD